MLTLLLWVTCVCVFYTISEFTVVWKAGVQSTHAVMWSEMDSLDKEFQVNKRREIEMEEVKTGGV